MTESDVAGALEQRAKEDEIEFLFLMFVDMHGRPCAKLVPSACLGQVMRDGVGFAGFAAGPMGQTPADPDLTAVPDPTSYTPLPWQDGVAVVQCDIYVKGEPWLYSPRMILKRQASIARRRGLEYKVGCEPEYFLLRKGADGYEVADERDCLETPCYDVGGLTRSLDYLTSVSRYLNELGWENYANDHEDANGQFEHNFAFADALTTADRIVLFRYMVKTLAERAGLVATFMPKPFTRLTGSGLHMHSSLWDAATGEELFRDDEDKRGLGLSSMAYGFVAGLLAHARALVAVTCPTVNSYKRMGVSAPRSGATWAPAYITYGGNNRTQMLRVPGPGRIENRACDGAANPYLAMSVQLAAGLDGIDRELDPGEPNEDDLYALAEHELDRRGIESLPPTLLHAVEALVEDEVIREALGSTARGAYVDYFATTKTREFLTWHAQVSNAEINSYLGLF